MGPYWASHYVSRSRLHTPSPRPSSAASASKSARPYLDAANGSESAPNVVESRFGARIGQKQLLQGIARILRAVSARGAASLPRAFSDLALGAAGKQTSRGDPASIAVGDVLGFQNHAVMLAGELRDPDSLLRLFRRVRLSRRHMDWAATTSQSTIPHQVRCFHIRFYRHNRSFHAVPQGLNDSSSDVSRTQ